MSAFAIICCGSSSCIASFSSFDDDNSFLIFLLLLPSTLSNRIFLLCLLTNEREEKRDDDVEGTCKENATIAVVKRDRMLLFSSSFGLSKMKKKEGRKTNKISFGWKYKIVYWRWWYHSSFISILHTDCRKADCLCAKEGFFQQIRGFGRGCRRLFVQPGHASARRLDRRLVSLFRSKQRNERQEARDDLFC